MHEIEPVYTVHSNEVSLNTSSSLKQQPTLLDESIFSVMDEDGDGLVSQEEAKKHDFSAWAITDSLSKTDFLSKLNFFNDNLMSDTKFSKRFASHLKQEEAQAVTSLQDMKSDHHADAYDARGKDISKLQLTREQLLNLRTDDTTVMSSEQKKLILKAKEDMKDPGLGVRALHEKGITGKGVKIAIIDQTFTEHSEYSEQVAEIEGINGASTKAGSKHAPAVASIAVGKTTGVAPEAQLYCFTSEATKEGKRTFENDAAAIRRILDKNKKLRENNEEPISVISISAPSHDINGIGEEELQQAIKEAQESGVFVATVQLDAYDGTYLFGADRTPAGDVNNPSSYKPSNMTRMDFGKNPPPEGFTSQILLVPQEHRTIAAAFGQDSYEYEGNQGGYSWTVPYLAGVFALAKQTNPDITPEQFLQYAKETGTTCSYNGQKYGKLINPEAIIDKVKTTNIQ